MVASLNTSRPVLGQEARYSSRIVNITAATTLTQELHDGAMLIVDSAAGIAITLPAALGTGAVYRFWCKTTVTSSSTTIKVANTTDSFLGNIIALQDGGNTLLGFEIVAADDTLTWNGTTTGGVAGDWVEIQDVASGLFRVLCLQSATGTEATPSSATV